MITMIVAMDEHHLIGQDQHLPWHCPDDLAHFYACTRGNQLLMGRTTFASLPMRMKQERIYVVTHQKIEEDENMKRCLDLQALLSEWTQKEENLFICGGAQIYEQSFPFVEEAIVSIMKGSYSGDTYLPELDFSVFKNCHIEVHKSFEVHHYTHRSK